MLAIFDTQVLSIFRRRREIGTLMALGMTRGKVIGLFTLEGVLNGVLAALRRRRLRHPAPRPGWPGPAGPCPATPTATASPSASGSSPSYGAGLVAGTTLLVLLTTTIVRFLPTRRIAKLKPTDALRGRMT